MSEKKFSPEDVAKILRTCHTPGTDCRDCPATNCGEFNFSLLAADAIEELLEKRQMDADLMQEQAERIGELEEKLEAQRWVYVGERLPVVGDDALPMCDIPCVEVLVMIEGSSVATALFCDGDDFFDVQGDEIIPYRVMCWRPMPEVPGEGGLTVGEGA